MNIDRVPCRNAALMTILSMALCCMVPASAQTLDVWIGTTTPKNGLSKGIYHARFNTQDGSLTQPQLAAELDNPGFLALHPGGGVLYATGMIADEPSLAAFRIVGADGEAKLSLINFQAIGDGRATHLSTDRSGRVLMSAQYGAGSTAIFPLGENGAIGQRSGLMKHGAGSGVVAHRQDQPHPHWVGTSPDNRFAFVPDLGMDKVVIYSLDSENAGLAEHGFGNLPPGSGPRHMKFHPDGETIYVLNELTLSVTVFAYAAARGEMAALQTIPTVSEADKAKELFTSASEIRVHPSGRFVYAANRGHDTITAFRTVSDDGRLSLVEVEPIRGSWPRNFNLDPTGKWLLAAGRDSNTISVFAIDLQTGELTYTRTMVMVPTPICILFGA